MCLGAFMALALLVQVQATGAADRFFFIAFRHKVHAVKQIARLTGSIASPGHDLLAAVMAAAVYVLYGAATHRLGEKVRGAILLSGTAALSYAANLLLKPAFGRVRPGTGAGDYSFPSDHAMMAFALLIPLASVLCESIRSKQIRWVIWFLTGVCTFGIGLSRVYLEKHYFTDIIGGYLFSGFIFCTLVAVFIPKHSGRQ